MTYPSTTVVQLMPQHLKSRYQRQYRNATFGLIRLLFVMAWIGVALAGRLERADASSSAVERQGVERDKAAADRAQSTAPVIYLLPEGAADVQLQTHTAEFQISDDQDSGLRISYAGLYRIKHEGEEPSTVTLIVASDQLDFPTGTAISATANGVPLSLEAIDEGFRTQVQVTPDVGLDVRLDYDVLIDEAALALLRYDARRVMAWSGSPSLRTTIFMPESIVPESWVSVTPEGWSYSSTADAGQVGIHWLLDGIRPAAPFVFRFFTPEYWRVLDAEEDAKGRGEPATYQRLGDSYSTLYRGIQAVDDGDAEAGKRFYAQALAAYMAGLDRVAPGSTVSAEVGALHAGLASLYRSRVLTADGTVDSDYTALMVQAATAALASMPVGDARHHELTQWQADGLRQLLVDAQRRGDWPHVTALLDQMAALPEQPLSPDAMAEVRRVATVLQALSLLESGQRESAMELAGADIVDAELQPESDLQSLFSSWHITATVVPASIGLDVQARSMAERVDEARGAFQQQIDEWHDLPTLNGVSLLFDENPMPDGGRMFRLQLSLDDRDAALTLAQGMALGPDWMLLHAVLEQMAPLVRTENRFLRRTVMLEQTLDLRAAHTQWSAMADRLAEQALAIEAVDRSINPNDPAAVEAALRARIRAANYRNASQAWRALDANSWVTTRLASSGNEAGRTWLATTSMPAETYVYESETVRPTRMVWVAGLILVVLLIISTLLWWLL